MSLFVPRHVLSGSADELVQAKLSSATGDTVVFTDLEVSDTLLRHLSDLAHDAADTKTANIIDAVLVSRGGEDTEIPHFEAAQEMLISYLRRQVIDGWIYVKGSDGHLHPYLVLDVVRLEPEGRGERAPYLVIEAVCNKVALADDYQRSAEPQRFYLYEREMVSKRPSDALRAHGIYKETFELRAEYDQAAKNFLEIANRFGALYRFSGTPSFERAIERGSWASAPSVREKAKVIIDVPKLAPSGQWAHSALLGAVETAGKMVKRRRKNAPEADSVGEVPLETVMKVFDLGTQADLHVNVRDLTEHAYDDSLRDKLVLPADQRRLLDVLTAHTEAFAADIIEGKSAGNVILAKGKPGVGKTLTAEVYAEILHKPLFSVHSGSLGMNAGEVRQRLEAIFRRAAAWDAVLLLDEADVFVLARGANLGQNAVVAEFLRTLEYFSGLLFMTTNRSDEIDEAILSRCAAIIDYQAPDAEGLAQVWRVLSANVEADMDEDLISALVQGLPDITPRDVKMLLRLALRMAAAEDKALSIETFAEVAMFRGHHFGQ